MKSRVCKIMIAAVIAAAASLQTNAETHSRSIVVESPSDLPELASRNSEAMYLHETGGGQTLLYLEQDQGRTLAILDVLHVNQAGGLTVAVSDNKQVTRIAARTVLWDNALSVLVPVSETVLGWSSAQIRSLFDSHGFVLQDWAKVHSDSVTIAAVAATRTAGL